MEFGSAPGAIASTKWRPRKPVRQLRRQRTRRSEHRFRHHRRRILVAEVSATSSEMTMRTPRYRTRTTSDARGDRGRCTRTEKSRRLKRCPSRLRSRLSPCKSRTKPSLSPPRSLTRLLFNVAIDAPKSPMPATLTAKPSVCLELPGQLLLCYQDSRGSRCSAVRSYRGSRHHEATALYSISSGSSSTTMIWARSTSSS